MGQQILVIGLGTFGSIVASELSGLGHEVMGCDRDPRVVAEHADRLTQVFEMDATDEDAVRAVGPADFDVTVVAIDPSATILATMILERSGARSSSRGPPSDLDGEILRRVGASRVIYTDHQVATWVAHTIDLAGALDFIRLTADVAAVHLRLGSATVGRRVGDLAQGATGLAHRRPPPRRPGRHQPGARHDRRGRRQRADRRTGGALPGARPVIERMFYHPPHGRLGGRGEVRSQAVPDGLAPSPERDAPCRAGPHADGGPAAGRRARRALDLPVRVRRGLPVGAALVGDR